MKICWDNLEKIDKITKAGNFKIRTATYIYMDSCKECNEPYLTNSKSEFCSRSCSKKGKIFSKDHRIKISNSKKGKLKGKENPMYGKKHSKETRILISKNRKNKHNRNNHTQWKGGVKKRNIPLYDTYAHQISYAEQVRRNKEDEKILEVRCTYCGKWYIPKQYNVRHRIMTLNGQQSGESRFYCSNECKKECPVYWKQKFSAEESNTKKYSREVQPELRQMVFERDEYTCQKCSSTKSLHCHHVEGIELNPIESADIDNCITLCKKCHKKVHSIKGCKRSDYRRKKCKEMV